MLPPRNKVVRYSVGHERLIIARIFPQRLRVIHLQCTKYRKVA
jgi:hypothetical protein